MRGSQLDNSAADGDRHRLRTIFRVQLVHDVLHVNFDGFLGDEERRADLPIPAARRHLFQDLHFAVTEDSIVKVFGKSSGDLRRNVLPASVDSPDGVQNHFVEACSLTGIHEPLPSARAVGPHHPQLS